MRPSHRVTLATVALATVALATVALASVALAPVVAVAQQAPAGGWPQRSRERPLPPVVVPPAQRLPVPAPNGAIVLFDGRTLDAWQTADGRPAGWTLVAGGAMEVVKDAGDIQTRQAFGDCEVHFEWAAPTPPEGSDQDRGNSGVFLMGRSEVQVLDSYGNVTYADGSAASIFGQFPPRVNASRPPGEWQTYDIRFTRPRFDSSGTLVRPARMTVRHNGVLVHDNVALLGPTSYMRRDPYVAHPDRLPLKLQDHGHPVRFRNIWIRDLEPATGVRK
jgi:hypothetical protein